MIHLTRNPLPGPKADAIRAWLQQPEARDFIDWLADEAAGATAEVGNLFVRDEAGDLLDAQTRAETARKLLSAHKIIVSVLTGEVELAHSVLTPEPFSKTTEPQ